MRRLAIALIGLSVLAACETTSGPPVGASVQPIEANRLQVSYRGRSGMFSPEVQDRALTQAAQVTLDRGGDWFRVTNRSQGVAPPTGPQFSLGIGGASFGRHSAVGVGTGTSFGGEGTYVSTLEIVVGRGPKPDDPSAYDARQVIATAGSRLR